MMLLSRATCSLALAASISAAGCGTESPIGMECSPIAEDAKDHDLLVEIEAMGLCASTAVDLGDEYLVEGDISVPKERLRNKQRRSATLVGGFAVEHITVRVDAALPAAWRTATQDAIVQWNNVTLTAVHFVLTNAATANISVVPDNGALPDANVIADARFPSGGLAGDRIRINTTFNNLAADSKLYVVVHELGHTIGLDHTDNGTGALIAGTPMTEAASVLNANLGVWAGLSTGDITAVRALYPLRIFLDTEFAQCDFGTAEYLLDWGTDDPGVIDWTLQKRAPASTTYNTIYQGTNVSRVHNASSTSQNYFRVRANTTLGPTAWKYASFTAPNCSAPEPPVAN